MGSEKTLCIATGIFPPDKGGPAQFSSSFSSWLSHKGVRSRVLSLTDGDSLIFDKGLSQIELISRKKKTLVRMLTTAYRIFRLARTHKFLVNGLFLEFFIASLFRQIDYVAKVPGDIVWERARNLGITRLEIDDFQSNLPRRFWLMRWTFSKSLARAKFVIAPSSHLRKIISDWGISESKIVVIPNSVDTELFQPQSGVKKIYDLVTVCRLVPWKGVREIIELSASRGLSLLVVGSGPQESELKAVARNLEAKVNFVGDIEQRELPNYLAEAKFFVLNSSYEGSPHSLIEAMSSGMPVVARENTGTSELVSSGKNGLLVGSGRTLNDAFSLLLGNELDPSSLGAAAREEIARNYSRAAIFSKIEGLTSSI